MHRCQQYKRGQIKISFRRVIWIGHKVKTTLMTIITQFSKHSILFLLYFLLFNSVWAVGQKRRMFSTNRGGGRVLFWIYDCFLHNSAIRDLAWLLFKTKAVMVVGLATKYQLWFHARNNLKPILKKLCYDHIALQSFVIRSVFFEYCNLRKYRT